MRSKAKSSGTRVKVAVGLSGGVDSSVAALKLVEGGYDVTGVHMRCWDYDSPGCKGNEDRADAIKIAAKLNISFVELNFEEEYKARVLNYFYNEIKLGRTPNPDVVCNQEIKFGLFLDWAIDKDFDYVATGHYARIEEIAIKNPKTNTKVKIRRLMSGIDASKDQSYFLYKLNEKQLAYILYPIGQLTKTGVRKIAKEAGLHNWGKKDSTGICFIGDVDFSEFVKREVDVKEGDVLDLNGEIVGKHKGVQLYTIGQRHGFELTKYQGVPVYVVEKDVKANTLTIGFGKDAQRNEFEVSDVNWINESIKPKGKTLKCLVRIRNLGEKMPAKITLKSDSNLTVSLQDYALGVAPGQSAVFYAGDTVLGGSTIV